jgi:hypothetical protein
LNSDDTRSTRPGAAATTIVPGDTAKSVPLWLSYVSVPPRKSRTCVFRTDHPSAIAVDVRLKRL